MSALKSTNGPMVSVVIPAFNAARIIGRAVESVAAQTFKNLEIIVVDDCSTDDLDGALAPFKDVALHIVRHRVNRGAAAARNTGVEAARGDYIAFLDADDAWFADKLEAQVACLEQMREPVKLCCVGYVLRRDERSADQTILLEGFSKTKQFDALLLGCNLSPGSTLMLPRASFEAIGPFDDRMCRLEDWDWLPRFTTRGRIAIVCRPLARIHVTGTPRPDHVLDVLQRMRALPERRCDPARRPAPPVPFGAASGNRRRLLPVRGVGAVDILYGLVPGRVPVAKQGVFPPPWRAPVALRRAPARAGDHGPCPFQLISPGRTRVRPGLLWRICG